MARYDVTGNQVTMMSNQANTSELTPTSARIHCFLSREGLTWYKMQRHKEAVEAIASQVQKFHERQHPFRIYHGTTNSTRQSQHRPENTISTADLVNVLEVNSSKQTVTVEPNVPMDGLVQATTVKHGLVPLVVMEFPGITVGGGFSGTSGESSSFRHGFFDASVNWIEMVLPNGEITTASKTNQPDLFWGAASSFGTLGVVTLLEVQLRPAKPLIELRYYSTSSMDEAMQVFQKATDDPAIEYLDGIVYARDHVVVCAGRPVNADPTNYAPVRFTRPWDEWYYLHVLKRSSQASASRPAVDYVPIVDYLFRYDRGGFWVGKYAYRYFFVPFTYITRVLLDWFMHTRVMYHALHESGHAKRYIIQDVAVPYSGTSEFVDWLDQSENFGEYPLWLCPLRHGPGVMERASAARSTSSEFEKDENNPKEEEYLMNFGVWGPSRRPSDRSAFLTQNRRLERKVLDLQGKKWLYAHAYYTEDEFWSIYDKKQYDALRERYHASYLPTLYQKVRVDLSPGRQRSEMGWCEYVKDVVWETRPVSGLYGVWKAFWGGEYFFRTSSLGSKGKVE